MSAWCFLWFRNQFDSAGLTERGSGFDQPEDLVSEDSCIQVWTEQCVIIGMQCFSEWGNCLLFASWIVSQGIELGTGSLRNLFLDDHVLIFKVGCVEITGGACACQYSDAFRVLEYTHIFTPLLMSFVQGPKITFMACFQIAKAHSHCQQKHW